MRAVSLRAVAAAIVAAFVCVLGSHASAQQSVALTVMQYTTPDLAQTITTSPGGIYGLCLQACRGAFAIGTTVTITAPAAGGTWGGACAGQAGPACTLTMDRARSVSLTYGRATLTLHQSHDPVGIVGVDPDPGRTFFSTCRPECRETYARGTTVTLRPALQPGMNPPVAFERWEGACAGQGATCRLTMDGDASVDVAWRDLSTPPPTSSGAYSVRVASNSDAMTFKIDPPGSYDHDCRSRSCEQHYDAGARVTITALRSSQTRFDHWDGVCAGQGPTCVFTVQGDTVVHVTLDGLPQRE